MRKRTAILVIDDEADFLELVSYHLRLTGWKVHCATDGPAGLRLAHEVRPEVILLDWSMSGMDGLEVLSELKYDPETAGIPVFMLTARTQVGEIEQAFEIGADDYITKPVELRSLNRVVRHKLSRLSGHRS